MTHNNDNTIVFKDQEELDSYVKKQFEIFENAKTIIDFANEFPDLWEELKSEHREEIDTLLKKLSVKAKK